MTVVSFLIATAWAEGPRHIEVPEPVPDTPATVEEQPAPADGSEKPKAPAHQSAPAIPTRTLEAAATPESVFGRFLIVELTESGRTEPFALRMERAAAALDNECWLKAVEFDFGPTPPVDMTKARPQRVKVREIRLCSRGGFGNYQSDIGLGLPVSWRDTDEGLRLEFGGAQASGSFARLREGEGDWGSPAQWRTPATEIDPTVRGFVVKEESIHRETWLHLVGDDVVYHLAPIATE